MIPETPQPSTILSYNTNEFYWPSAPTACRQLNFDTGNTFLLVFKIICILVNSNAKIAMHVI